MRHTSSNNYPNHAHWYKGTVHFLRGRGEGEAPFKNRMTPSQLTSFFSQALMAIIFSDDPPFKKKDPLSRFQLLIFSIIPLLHVIVLTICRQCLQSPYYRELFIKKHKSKEREVNFWSPSYGSPWARGIWPIIGIFLIWINERKNDITWLIFSPLPSRVNGFTVILLIVTFTCLTAVSACPVVILCQCPGQLWEDSSTASMNVFQLPILSHSCLFKCCFSPWSLKYLFS